MDRYDNKKRLFLITNDDGVHAKGLKTLIELVRPLGRVVVVAPDEPQSGMSHAITVKYPIRLEKIRREEDLWIYSCSGTPVDCVKIALNKLVKGKPDIILSGINHGSNSSTSIFYSGTMAAAMEGCINRIPSIGFSSLDISQDADFSGITKYIRMVIEHTLENGLSDDICLNMNFPVGRVEPVKGIKVCRQNKGLWHEEFDTRVDPQKREYFWLTGEFIDLEPDAVDTDEWALRNNYIALVPVKVDMTAYGFLDDLKKWKLNDE